MLFIDSNLHRRVIIREIPFPLAAGSTLSSVGCPNAASNCSAVANAVICGVAPSVGVPETTKHGLRCRRHNAYVLFTVSFFYGDFSIIQLVVFRPRVFIINTDKNGIIRVAIWSNLKTFRSLPVSQEWH